MLGKTHKVGGICAGVLTTAGLLQTTEFAQEIIIVAPLLISSAALGSLIPDIDHPNSKLGRRVKPVSILVNKAVGHRGFTHTLVALMLFAFSLFMINLNLPVFIQPYGWAGVLGLVVGYASHLLLDALTPSGVPLLAPFTSQSFRLAKLKTGQYDALVSLGMILSTGAILYFTFPLPIF